MFVASVKIKLSDKIGETLLFLDLRRKKGVWHKLEPKCKKKLVTEGSLCGNKFFRQ